MVIKKKDCNCFCAFHFLPSEVERRWKRAVFLPFSGERAILFMLWCVWMFADLSLLSHIAHSMKCKFLKWDLRECEQSFSMTCLSLDVRSERAMSLREKVIKLHTHRDTWWKTRVFWWWWPSLLKWSFLFLFSLEVNRAARKRRKLSEFFPSLPPWWHGSDHSQTESHELVTMSWEKRYQVKLTVERRLQSQ